MKFNKKSIFVFLGLLAFGNSNAQQIPHYSQYMFNQSIFNPAYAGINESLSLGVLHRQQWVGLEGAPATSTAFAHTRVGKKVGVGLSFINDVIGPVQENKISADISYTVKLAPGHKLALGVKGGMTLRKANFFSDIYDHVPDRFDPAFSENVSSQLFNAGAGAFYYTDNYYVGFSVPNFIGNVYSEIGGYKFGHDAMHMFLTGGYVHHLGKNWEVKPSTMVKYTLGAPVTFDVNLNTRYKEKLEFGVSYRLEDSFGAMVNYAILPNLKVGYAYDYVVSDLSAQTQGSHEVFVLFDIFFKKKVSSSPRYF